MLVYIAAQIPRMKPPLKPTIPNNMKKLLFSILFAATCAAQTPATFIKGDLTIRYEARQKVGVEGITDKYNLNLNVSNSAILRGVIEARPFISNSFSANQNAQLAYNLETDVVNPNNPAQTRNVGKIVGVVPINEENVYNFGGGSAMVNVFGIGSARGFDSKFQGLALGKPPAKTGFAALKQDAIKLVNGKGAAISIGKYDKMEFQSLGLPSGPVAVYPEVTISGAMIYDYARSAWHFQNVTVTYTTDNKRVQDSITGNIRWNKGAYEFDVKINEPAPSEAAVFNAVADESAFFAVDNETPSLSGKMTYKDSESGGKVVASNVTIDLTGNKIDKKQTMYLAKLIFLVAVVPFNAE